MNTFDDGGKVSVLANQATLLATKRSCDTWEPFDKFHGRWIARDGAIEWLPRSQDITPSNYFLWGFIKDPVYKSRIVDLDEHKERIHTAI
ncbi:hypothetical protein HZH66_007008 [Vespula vulgaris]|uniref:Uncharacterized protein n=1 Tax=Vespula vulgaris TaxID=7454 RepID=A0A834JYV9_VESVU|nr:hypothetical protein HZH66_007008 [Vespula vulgaris]